MRQLLFLLVLTTFGFIAKDKILQSSEAAVTFRSDAKLELIQARSNEIRGIINTEKRTFAFSVPMASFQGFNSPLQRQHFNENYLESNQFKNATFTGKIIEKIDLKKNGVYSVRAKGKLKIHGITKERIIKSQLTIEDGLYKVESGFSIALSEHDIDIPRIVRQKIAEEIQISINAIFEEK